MTDYSDSRWMPPSPHREAILEELRKGRAHIEQRGHGLSPLFVYEDGGAMELALLRVVDGRLVAVADAKLPETSTKHVDVCGTVDELERLWEQEPSLADEDPEQLLTLVDHALSMLRRMQSRLEAYREFAQGVKAVAEEMATLVHPDHGPAPELGARLRARIREGAAAVIEHREEMVELAEGIRDIASKSEQVLYRYRDLAIEVGRLYEGIRGARAWKTSQDPKREGGAQEGK